MIRQMDFILNMLRIHACKVLTYCLFCSQSEMFVNNHNVIRHIFYMYYVQYLMSIVSRHLITSNEQV